MASDNKNQPPPDDDEEDDPVDAMIKKTGCADLQFELQMCMAEKKDWRQCQDKVKQFRDCVENANLRSQKSAKH